MKRTITMLLAAAGMAAAAPASAAKYISGQAMEGRYTAAGLAQPHMTYTTIGQVNTSRTTGYSGVGSLFVSYVSTATTGFGSICTGALIGGKTVLTAAHCLENDASDRLTGITFYLPSLGDRATAGGRSFVADAYAIHPDYETTGLAGGNDIAAFSIVGDTTGFDKYDLYLDDPFGAFDVVGTGTIGGPQGSNIGVVNDYRKRVGRNVYEYYGSDVFDDSSEGVVLYDFDDGTAAHDVFGRAGGNRQTGITGEASSSPGDSGGPSFIDGKIAAVTSFGITGGIYQGYCGADSSDPYNRTGGTARTALANCTNSSIGEIGGNTLVSYNIDFVRSYLAGTAATTGTVPEPASWAMMIGGFGLVGGAMRRRAKAATAFA